MYLNSKYYFLGVPRFRGSGYPLQVLGRPAFQDRPACGLSAAIPHPGTKKFMH